MKESISGFGEGGFHRYTKEKIHYQSNYIVHKNVRELSERVYMKDILCLYENLIRTLPLDGDAFKTGET